MRVALVTRKFGLGGSIERNAFFLARELVAAGVQVDCFCNPALRTQVVEGVHFQDVRSITISTSRFGQPLELASYAAAATRALRRERSHYDVIDVRGFSGWEQDVVCVDVVARADQQRWAAGAGRSYRAAEQRAAVAPVLHPVLAVRRAIQRLQFRPGRFVRAVAETEQTRADLMRAFGISADDIDVVPPPCDVRTFAEPGARATRAEIGVPNGGSLALFVGHDFERKGLGAAISALGRIRAEAHLAVVGGGDRERFAALARSEGVGDRVHFLGPTAQPDRYYSAADVFVLPTRSDPWGNTLIEAMAAGLPIVTTSAAGAAATVRDARAGIVLADDSVSELAEALESLVGDPAYRHELGGRGREAAPSFDVQSHARAMIGVYERVMTRRGRRQ